MTGASGKIELADTLLRFYEILRRSPSLRWMQIHADVSGVPIRLTRVPDAAALGSAILAAVGAGTYPSIQTACDAMGEFTRAIEPNMDNHRAYQPLLEAYRATYANLRDTLHAQAAIARG